MHDAHDLEVFIPDTIEYDIRLTDNDQTNPPHDVIAGNSQTRMSSQAFA